MAMDYFMTWEKNMSNEIDDQANVRRLRCKICNGLGYVTKKQTHPREGLIEVRDQCNCMSAILPIPTIQKGSK